MKAIPFRISKIKVNQFASFEDKFIENEDFDCKTDVHFALNSDIKTIVCRLDLQYIQHDLTILKLDVESLFFIANQGTEEFKNLKKIPKEFLQYLATIAIGTSRGIIFAKTEGTKFSKTVLPPINLTTFITEDMKIKE